MPTLAAFYKKIDLAQEGSMVQENTTVFDYLKSLKMLRASLHKNSPGWDFVTCTDQITEIDLPEKEIFRSDLDQQVLMASLIKSNTHYVKTHPGQSLLCGVDHLVAKSLTPMFQDQFDITLLINGGKINNTVVLINTNSSNHYRVVDFFDARQKFYDELSDSQKQWLGDQVSFEYALKHWGFEESMESYVGRTISSQGLTVKFIGYNELWVHGVKKKVPAYAPRALFLDFKGPRRKQWFNEVYQSVMDIRN